MLTAEKYDNARIAPQTIVEASNSVLSKPEESDEPKKTPRGRKPKAEGRRRDVHGIPAEAPIALQHVEGTQGRA